MLSCLFLSHFTSARRKMLGFSLLELLIVISLLLILTRMAYPQYTAYLTRAHRLEGRAALLDLAMRMEEYYAREHTYENASIGRDRPDDLLPHPYSLQGYYQLVITQATATQFSLHAIPTKTQAQRDRRCQTLSFNSQGQKGIAYCCSRA